MTDEQLKQLRELVAAGEKATKGPLKWDGADLWHVGNGYLPDETGDPHLYTGITSHPKLQNSQQLAADKNWIIAAANAREALSALLAERDALREALITAKNDLRSVAIYDQDTRPLDDKGSYDWWRRSMKQENIARRALPGLDAALRALEAKEAK